MCNDIRLLLGVAARTAASRSWVAGVILVLLVGTDLAAAGERGLELMVVRQREADHSICELTAVHVRDADGSERIDRLDPPISMDGPETSLTVTIPETTDTIGIESRECWVDPGKLVRDSSHLVLRSWPRGTLKVRLGSRGLDDEQATAGFVDSKADEDAAVQEVSCTVEKHVAACEIPAGRLIHLRFEREGFAPIYLLNVAVSEGEPLALDPPTWIPAYSVAGRVTERAGQSVEGAEVQLIPITAMELPRSQRLLRTRTAKSDVHGRYRIDGVEPGSYRLVSHVKEEADAEVPRLEVVDRDVHAPPLIHSPPSWIEVHLDPPVAWDALPWRLQVTRPGTRSHEVVVVADDLASPGGYWKSDALSNGTYEVVVISGVDSEVARQKVQLDGNVGRVSIRISGIPVRGRLLAGDEGVPGTLAFSAPSGSRVQAESDEAGHFEARFPTPGSWQVMVTPSVDAAAQLRLDPVEIRENMGELKILLPRGRIEGRVVSPEGDPAAAIITVRRAGRVVAQGKSGDDGQFSVDHLPEELQTVEAEGEAGRSRAEPADLSKQTRIEVELKLEESSRLKGLVVGPAGYPISGAIVRAFDDQTGRFNDTIADAEGLFEMDMHTDGVIDLIVLAPPHPVAVRRLAPSEWKRRLVNISMSSLGASLRVVLTRVPPWPVLMRAGGPALSLRLLLMPRFGQGTPAEFIDGAFQYFIEPGSYRICLEDECRELTLPPGVTMTVDYVSEEDSP